MAAEPVTRIRQFNRAVVDWICSRGAASAHTVHSLEQFRVMQAIGIEGSHPSRLMAETQLSRDDVTLLLIALEDAGMAALDRSDSKEEIVEARLTTAGHSRLIDDEHRLDDAFEDTLSVLSSTQRRRLLYAMRQVVRILRAASIEIRVGDPHHRTSRCVWTRTSPNWQSDTAASTPMSLGR